MNVESNDGADELYELVIRASQIDSEAVSLLRTFFSGDDVWHSHSFTGIEQVTVFTKKTAQAIGHLLAWFKLHQSRYPDATIEIGKEKVLIKGYAADEAMEILGSGRVAKLLRDLRAK